MSATVLEHVCSVTKFYIQWCTPSIWRQEQTHKQFQTAKRKKVFKNQALRGADFHSYKRYIHKLHQHFDNQKETHSYIKSGKNSAQKR